jgi:hypothetical protein
MYAPIIQSARTRRTYSIGDRRAAFLDELRTEGSIEYEYLLAVFEPAAGEPFLIVTSERNKPDLGLIAEMGFGPPDVPLKGASHFFCVFDADGHHNMGDSDRWAIASEFEAAALEFLTARLGANPKVDKPID